MKYQFITLQRRVIFNSDGEVNAAVNNSEVTENVLTVQKEVCIKKTVMSIECNICW